MAQMRPSGEAVFQEGPGGRVVILQHKSQIDSLRKQIEDWKKGIPDAEGRAVIWIEIPKNQESNYINSGGFPIQGAGSIYGEFRGPDKIPDPGVNVGEWASDLAARIDQTDPNWVDPIYQTGGRAEGMNVYENTPEGRRVQRQSDVPNQAELERLGMAQGWNRAMSAAEWLGFQGVEGFINPSTGRQGTGGMIGQQQVTSTKSAAAEERPETYVVDRGGPGRDFHDIVDQPIDVVTTDTGSTRMYAPDGTSQLVPNSELTQFKNNNRTWTDTPLSAADLDLEGGIQDPSAGETMLGEADLGVAEGESQIINPAVMLEEIIKGLIAGSQSGATPSDTEVIQMIMDRLNVSQSDALDHFTNIVKPEWTTGITTTATIPDPSVVPTPLVQPLGVGDGIPGLPGITTEQAEASRRAALFAQSDEDVLRRFGAETLGPGIGTPIGRRAFGSAANRFGRFRPLTTLFDPVSQDPNAALGAEFQEFLRGGYTQPTSQELVTLLAQAQERAGTDPIVSAMLENRFFSPSATTDFGKIRGAVGLAAMPALAGVNPSFRPGLEDVFMRRAQQRFAEDPAQYQTVEQILSNFGRFNPPGGFQGNNPAPNPDAFWNQQASATGQWT